MYNGGLCNLKKIAAGELYINESDQTLKISVCCHHTNPGKWPLPQKILLAIMQIFFSLCKDTFTFILLKSYLATPTLD